MANENSRSLWAIVPVKPFFLTKSRLAAVLTIDERAALSRRMLRHVLAILVEVEAIDRILLVSREPSLPSIAAEYRVAFYAEHTTAGLNPTLMEVRGMIGERADHLLILPSDLPFLTPADVALLIGRTKEGALCSDRHRTGTNALLLPTGSPFQFQYGYDSFARHRQEFDRAAVPYQMVESPGLMFDVDTPADLNLLQTTNQSVL